MDLDVLAALAHRDRYERYARFVKQTSLAEEAWNIFQAMGEWFKQNKKYGVVEWGKFGAWFSLVRAAKMPKEKLTVHKQLIQMLALKADDETDLSPLIHGLAKRDFASRIGDLALRIADGEDSSFDQINTLLAEHDKFTGKVDRLDTSFVNFEEAKEEALEPGLEWRLRSLQLSAGELRQGDLVVFGKRPDAGGTTFLASEATYMAEQLDPHQQVIWINNEERGQKVRDRIIQAALGWHTRDILANKKKALAEYIDLMGGNQNKIALYDFPGVHIRDVDAILERHDVGLIVLDQGWKIHGFEDEGETVRQMLLANWMRETAKKYAPVITVHQAGGEAEGMRYIPYSMLYGSKTGVPGEADLIVMMGRDYNSGNTRFLWTPKNKMQTPGDYSQRNTKWELEIQSDYARFREYV